MEVVDNENEFVTATISINFSNGILRLRRLKEIKNIETILTMAVALGETINKAKVVTLKQNSFDYWISCFAIYENILDVSKFFFQFFVAYSK